MILLAIVGTLLAQHARAEAITRQHSDLDPHASLAKYRGEGIFPLQGKPTQARLYIQNMDADEDLEYLLLLADLSYQVAIVMKQIDGKWWNLASLLGRNRGELDAFVSLKPLVWPGTYDVILRAGGSQGTGVGATTQSVYRILRGNMYKVFEVVDGSYNWTSTESANVTYPGPDDDVKTIVARRIRNSANGGRKVTSCEAFRWNPKEFVFLSTQCH